ncbi:hypothetical protein CPB86DRAFT_493450 [Serendipita vermifera]|nr:hypothetical protein CPB86DRAFT_493450 [Serendipita vermifera]
MRINLRRLDIRADTSAASSSRRAPGAASLATLRSSFFMCLLASGSVNIETARSGTYCRSTGTGTCCSISRR